MGKDVVFTTIGNEFIIDTTPNLDLSQMRTYAMLGYQLSTTTHLQGGYMYISYPSKDGQHRLQFFLTQKFDYHNKD